MLDFPLKSNQNQIFHYTRCNTPERVTSWRGPSPRHCARATQLLSKKCRNGGEPLATLCPILPARDLNLRPPAPETNALPLDRQTKFQPLRSNSTTKCFWCTKTHWKETESNKPGGEHIITFFPSTASLASSFW